MADCKAEEAYVLHEPLDYERPGRRYAILSAPEQQVKLSVVLLFILSTVAITISAVAMSDTRTLSGRVDDLQKGGVSMSKQAKATSKSLMTAHSTVSSFPFCQSVNNLQHCHDLMDTVSDKTNVWHDLDSYNVADDSSNVVSALFDASGSVTALSKDTASPKSVKKVQEAATKMMAGDKSACTVMAKELCIVDLGGKGVAVLAPVMVVDPNGEDRRRGYGKACATGATGGAVSGCVATIPAGCWEGAASGAVVGCVAGMASHFVSEIWPDDDDE